MVDVDTFLTALYVMVDDFCHSHRPKRQPGPEPALSESEVIERVMNLGENRIEMRIPRSAWFPRDLRFRHS